MPVREPQRKLQGTPQLLLASNNPGKLEEIRALLAGSPFEIVTPAQLGIRLEVDESGRTYAENAALKGVAFAQATGLLTMADDSGLEVDALDGAPGVCSARYAPKPGATDADRCTYLLRNLAHKPRPWTARFRCVVALVLLAGEGSRDIVQVAEGICPGEIIPDERGENGFGYDPVFLLPELGRTMAELSMVEKNRLSHRARAVKAAQPVLLEMLSCH
jgi:XTP/dITP diphosphohydrolase